LRRRRHSEQRRPGLEKLCGLRGVCVRQAVFAGRRRARWRGRHDGIVTVHGADQVPVKFWSKAGQLCLDAERESVAVLGNAVSGGRTKAQSSGQGLRHGGGAVIKERDRGGDLQKVAAGILSRRAFHGRFAFCAWATAHYVTASGRVQCHAHTRLHQPRADTMTTRRTVGEEKAFLENDPRGPPGPSNISPAVPA
jgi:hypothetical protein